MHIGLAQGSGTNIGLDQQDIDVTVGSNNTYFINNANDDGEDTHDLYVDGLLFERNAW